ncbi:hypothetical protein HDV05_005876 [Chytridiales sp. JEL 0842]|nr:hypothetical protein HDV05_005876 [Chytridiales sp. JEL 0842]
MSDHEGSLPALPSSTPQEPHKPDASSPRDSLRKSRSHSINSKPTSNAVSRNPSQKISSKPVSRASSSARLQEKHEQSVENNNKSTRASSVKGSLHNGENAKTDAAAVGEVSASDRQSVAQKVLDGSTVVYQGQDEPTRAQVIQMLATVETVQMDESGKDIRVVSKKASKTGSFGELFHCDDDESIESEKNGTVNKAETEKQLEEKEAEVKAPRSKPQSIKSSKSLNNLPNSTQVEVVKEAPSSETTTKPTPNPLEKSNTNTSLGLSTPKLALKSLSAKNINEIKDDSKAQVISRATSGVDVNHATPLASRAISSWLYGSDDSVASTEEEKADNQTDGGVNPGLKKGDGSKASLRFYGSLANIATTTTTATKSIIQLISQPSAPITPGSPVRQLSELPSPESAAGMNKVVSTTSLKAIKKDEVLATNVSQTIASWVQGEEEESQASSAQVSGGGSRESVGQVSVSSKAGLGVLKKPAMEFVQADESKKLESVADVSKAAVDSTAQGNSLHEESDRGRKTPKSIKTPKSQRSQSLKKSEVVEEQKQTQVAEPAPPSLKKSTSRASLRTATLIKSASKMSLNNLKDIAHSKETQDAIPGIKKSNSALSTAHADTKAVDTDVDASKVTEKDEKTLSRSSSKKKMKKSPSSVNFADVDQSGNGNGDKQHNELKSGKELKKSASSILKTSVAADIGKGAEEAGNKMAKKSQSITSIQSASANEKSANDSTKSMKKSSSAILKAAIPSDVEVISTRFHHDLKKSASNLSTTSVAKKAESHSEVKVEQTSEKVVKKSSSSILKPSTVSPDDTNSVQHGASQKAPSQAVLKIAEPPNVISGSKTSLSKAGSKHNSKMSLTTKQHEESVEDKAVGGSHVDRSVSTRSLSFKEDKSSENKGAALEASKKATKSEVSLSRSGSKKSINKIASADNQHSAPLNRDRGPSSTMLSRKASSRNLLNDTPKSKSQAFMTAESKPNLVSDIASKTSEAEPQPAKSFENAQKPKTTPNTPKLASKASANLLATKSKSNSTASIRAEAAPASAKGSRPISRAHSSTFVSDAPNQKSTSSLKPQGSTSSIKQKSLSKSPSQNSVRNTSSSDVSDKSTDSLSHTKSSSTHGSRKLVRASDGKASVPTLPHGSVIGTLVEEKENSTRTNSTNFSSMSSNINKSKESGAVGGSTTGISTKDATGKVVSNGTINENDVSSVRHDALPLSDVAECKDVDAEKSQVVCETDKAATVAATEEKSDSGHSESLDALIKDPGMAKAAVMIQSAFRGNNARKQSKCLAGGDSSPPKESSQSTVEKETGVEEAATKIQSVFRGHTVRKQKRTLDSVASMEAVKTRESPTPNKKNDASEDASQSKEVPTAKAATKIQAVFRGHTVRKQKSTAPKIEASVPRTRSQPLIDAESGVESAATKIQSVFRGHTVRKQKAKVAEPVVASSKVQKVDAVEDVQKEEKAAVDKAATKIQSVFRGHTVRKPKPTHPVMLESVGKSKSQPSVLKDKSLDDAATKIQSAFRGHTVRKPKKSAPQQILDKESHRVDGEKEEPVKQKESHVENVQTADDDNSATANDIPISQPPTAAHPDENVQAAEAATKIQSVFRGHVIRKQKQETPGTQLELSPQPQSRPALESEPSVKHRQNDKDLVEPGRDEGQTNNDDLEEREQAGREIQSTEQSSASEAEDSAKQQLRDQNEHLTKEQGASDEEVEDDSDEGKEGALEEHFEPPIFPNTDAEGGNNLVKAASFTADINSSNSGSHHRLHGSGDITKGSRDRLHHSKHSLRGSFGSITEQNDHRMLPDESGERRLSLLTRAIAECEEPAEKETEAADGHHQVDIGPDSEENVYEEQEVECEDENADEDDGDYEDPFQPMADAITGAPELIRRLTEIAIQQVQNGSTASLTGSQIIGIPSFASSSAELDNGCANQEVEIEPSDESQVDDEDADADTGAARDIPENVDIIAKADESQQPQTEPVVPAAEQAAVGDKKTDVSASSAGARSDEQMSLKPLKPALKSSSTSKTSLPDLKKDPSAESRHALHVGFQTDEQRLSFVELNQDIKSSTHKADHQVQEPMDARKKELINAVSRPRSYTARPIKLRSTGFELRRSAVVDAMAQQLIDQRAAEIEHLNRVMLLRLTNPWSAVKNADVLYTDVAWESARQKLMEQEKKLERLQGARSTTPSKVKQNPVPVRPKTPTQPATAGDSQKRTKSAAVSKRPSTAPQPTSSIPPKKLREMDPVVMARLTKPRKTPEELLAHLTASTPSTIRKDKSLKSRTKVEPPCIGNAEQGGAPPIGGASVGTSDPHPPSQLASSPTKIKNRASRPSAERGVTR